jgi:hypothetical protein
LDKGEDNMWVDLKEKELLLITDGLVAKIEKNSNEIKELEEFKKSDKPIYVNAGAFGGNMQVEISGEKRDSFIDSDIQKLEEKQKKLMELQLKILNMVED